MERLRARRQQRLLARAAAEAAVAEAARRPPGDPLPATALAKSAAMPSSGSAWAGGAGAVAPAAALRAAGPGALAATAVATPGLAATSAAEAAAAACACVAAPLDACDDCLDCATASPAAGDEPHADPRPSASLRSAPPAAASSSAASLAVQRPPVRRMPLTRGTGEPSAAALPPRRPPPRAALPPPPGPGGPLDAQHPGLPSLGSRRPPPGASSSWPWGATTDDELCASLPGGAAAAPRAAPGGALPPSPRAHARSLAKLLSSFAKAGVYQPQLFRLLTAELAPRLRHLTPHELSLVLAGLAATEHRSAALLEAAAPALLALLPRLSPSDATRVATSYARLGWVSRPLFEALSAHAVHGHKWHEPLLSRLAWAHARLRLPLRAPLLAKLRAARAAGGEAGGGGGRRRREGADSASDSDGSDYDGADGTRPRPVNAARAEAE